MFENDVDGGEMESCKDDEAGCDDDGCGETNA